MSSLVLRRASVSWQDRVRDYVVLVDGIEQGRIGNGGEVSIEVSPGTHAIQLKVDWCRSRPLEVRLAEGETKSLACGPNSHPFLVLFYIIFRTGDYIWLREDDGARSHKVA